MDDLLVATASILGTLLGVGLGQAALRVFMRALGRALALRATAKP
jgi:hypothetical protein